MPRRTDDTRVTAVDGKQADDRPQPMLGCFLSWIAVRTGDQRGVIDLLGLADPQPVTFAQGAAAADSDSHDFAFGPPYPQYARVFLTPELDGWTLVVGRWCSPIDEERSVDVAYACRRLSALFGAAQAYFHSAQQDGSAWLVAENGVVVRRGAAGDEPAAGAPEWEIGEPLTFELEEEASVWAESEDPEWEWEFALLNMAPKLAGALSLNPLTLGDTTPCRGRGTLALTPYGTRYGVPRTALKA